MLDGSRLPQPAEPEAEEDDGEAAVDDADSEAEDEYEVDAEDGELAHTIWTNWLKPNAEQRKHGILFKLQNKEVIRQVTWHYKGDYFASCANTGTARSVLVHQLSKQNTQNPFSRSKGSVQAVTFHPSRPFFFVATQRYVRIYNLQKQQLAKKLTPGVKWISSIAVHPGGDNLIVGTYDKRTLWFDLDLSAKPYKMLKYHKRAVRGVSYSPRFPLFASASDDGTVQVFHAQIFNDLLKNPEITPVKILRGHKITNELGVMNVTWHPTQPWLISCGADGTARLWA